MPKLKHVISRYKKPHATVVTGKFDLHYEDLIKRNRYLLMALTGGTIALLAIVIPVAVYRSLAGTGAASLEAEDGTLTTQAVATTDATASGGQYVTFTPPSCPAGQTGTPPNCVAAQGITKVMWIWEENDSASDVIGNADMPYVNGLATTYGYANNARSETTPSEPNYIAATSGSTHGITDDNNPSAHPLSGASIFSQLPAGQAKVFAESMSTNCQATNGTPSDVNGAGFYAVRHTGWPYYVDSNTDCKKYQVPLGANFQTAINSGLPKFSEVVPAICNDMHKGGSPDVCNFAAGQNYDTRADAWVKGWINKVKAGPDWQAGNLVIFLVWDEGSGTDPPAGTDCTTNNTYNHCHIPLIVISPQTLAINSSTRFSHYSMLRTTEEIFGLPFLGAAANANSMRAAFNLN